MGVPYLEMNRIAPRRYAYLRAPNDTSLGKENVESPPQGFRGIAPTGSANLLANDTSSTIKVWMWNTWMLTFLGLRPPSGSRHGRACCIAYSTATHAPVRSWGLWPK